MTDEVDDVRERGGRAAFELRNPGRGMLEWEALDEHDREQWRRVAGAVLAATDQDRLLSLAGALIRASWDGGLDSGEVQDLLAEHGVLHEVPATEADCEQAWAREYGVEPGDPIFKPTELGKRALEAAKR